MRIALSAKRLYVYIRVQKGGNKKGRLKSAPLFFKIGQLGPVEEITIFLQVAMSLAPFF